MSDYVQSSLVEYSSNAETEGCQCDTCGQAFDTERAVSIHQTQAHGDSDPEKCPTCGEVFNGSQGVKVHRARAHDEDASGEEFQCAHCGETAQKQKHQIENNENNFCSDACETAWREERYSGEGNPNYDRVEVTCEHCGTTEKVASYRSDTFRFCSMGCKANWQSENRTGEQAFAWEGGTATIECEHCGNTHEVYPAVEEEARFCSSDCFDEWRSEHQTGPDNPSWNGGKETLTCERCGDEYPCISAKVDTSRFCSSDCFDEWRSEHWTGQANHMWRGGSTIRLRRVGQERGRRTGGAIAMRTRTCDTDRERERIVDDYVTQGYTVVSDGGRTTKLRQRDYGGLLAHVVLFLLTLGVGNLLYALYRRHVSTDVVVVRVEPDE